MIVPLVPVIVSVAAPTGVVADVIVVSVAVPAPAIDAGVNVVVVPVGCPLTLSATDPVKPLTAVVLIAYEVPPPWITLFEAGVTERVKSGTDAGMICSPLSGARTMLSVEVPGVAVSVNPVAL